MSAQADAFDARVDRAAAAAPKQALGVAYSLGPAAPVLRVAGPVSRRDAAPVSPDAPWHIGSISKSFTASLIMRLVEQGALSLDSPVGDDLPRDRADMHPDWQAVTLRQLLSHSAGLPGDVPRAALANRSTETLHEVRREVLQSVWDAPLKGAAGTAEYSNFGYVLAGFVAEEVTGKSWESLIRTEIAEVLGLDSLGFGAPQATGAAWGHQKFLGIRRPVPPGTDGSDNPPWLGPAGTLHLSLGDLVRWGQAHLAACRGEMPEFLTAEGCQEMHREAADGFGLGWAVAQSADGPRSWHNGSNTMWYALLIVAPQEDIVLAVTTNTFDANRIDQLARGLFEDLAGSGARAGD